MVDTKLITNPSHYCEGRKFEPKDVIRDWNLNFNLGKCSKIYFQERKKGWRRRRERFDESTAIFGL